MKLPNFRRIYKTEFKREDQDLIDKLASSLNDGIEKLYNALNNSLTLKDNIACTVAEFDLYVDSDGNPKAQTSFKLRNTDKIEGLTPIKIENIDNVNTTSLPVYGINIDFTQQSQQVIINNIKGLPANVKFRIKVIAFN